MDGPEKLREEIKQRIDIADEAVLYRIYALLESVQPTESYWWDELDSDIKE